MSTGLCIRSFDHGSYPFSLYPDFRILRVLLIWLEVPHMWERKDADVLWDCESLDEAAKSYTPEA